MSVPRPSWAADEPGGAACERLPFEEAAALFTPESDGGSMRRTKAFPAADNHAAARAVCARCPILSDCLLDGLRNDSWTVRGGLTPEERAAYGGLRDPYTTRRRGVYLTRPRVWARVEMSALPTGAVQETLTRWRDYLRDGDESRLGCTILVAGAARGTPHETAQSDPDLLRGDDWFTPYVPPPRRRKPVRPAAELPPL